MAKKLKIGLVLDTSLDQPDGVQQYIISVGEWLRSKGHDVHYVVGETHRTDLKNIHSLAKNINVRFNGNSTTIPLPVSSKKLKAFLDRECFDVLHVQMPHSPFLAQRLVLASGPRTAIIGTFHIAPYNWTVTVGSTMLGWWLKPSIKRFDQIVSVSEAGAKFAKRAFGIESEVLPNVVDYKRFNSAIPFKKYQSKRIKILFLGRLVPRKGSETLLQAINSLKNQIGLPKFEVIICGKGPLKAKLEAFVRQNNLERLVNFEGFISEKDKPRYYSSADIAVFPSSGGESFGIVLIEAMASGAPAVLAGDNPGYRTVMSQRPDLLFNPKSAPELADLLSQHIRYEAIRLDAQKWGVAYSKTFDINRVGRQLESLYLGVLAKK